MGNTSITYNVHKYNDSFVVAQILPEWPCHFYTELFKTPSKALKAVMKNKFNPRYKNLFISDIGEVVVSFTVYK